jgi:hypothetical protein
MGTTRICDRSLRDAIASALSLHRFSFLLRHARMPTATTGSSKRLSNPRTRSHKLRTSCKSRTPTKACVIHGTAITRGGQSMLCKCAAKPGSTSLRSDRSTAPRTGIHGEEPPSADMHWSLHQNLHSANSHLFCRPVTCTLGILAANNGYKQ